MDLAIRKKAKHIADLDLDDVMDEVAALKSEVEKTVKRLKKAALGPALESAHDFAEQLTDDAAALYKDWSKRGRKTARRLNKHVERQPVATLLIAFSAGLLVSRLFDRD